MAAEFREAELEIGSVLGTGDDFDTVGPLALVLLAGALSGATGDINKL